MHRTFPLTYVCGWLQTISMILGERPAPWEDPATSRALLRPLGIFKAHVLELVARDPSQRSSIRRFNQSCLRSLSNSTITPTTSITLT